MDWLENIINTVIEWLTNFGGADVTDMQISTTALSQGFQDVYQYFTIFGVGLALAYFIVELNKQMMFNGQNVTLKQLFVPFLKLIIAIGCCAFATEFFSMLLGFNNQFMRFCGNLTFTTIGTPSNVGFTIDGFAQALKDPIGFMIKNMSFFAKVMMLIPMIFAFIITLITNLVFDYKALLYKVELLARIMFAPIAVSDIYTGTNSGAVKYVKGTIALVIYGGSLIFVPKLVMGLAFQGAMNSFSAIVNSTAPDVFQFCEALGLLIICPIAAIGLTSVVKQVIREAVC